MQKFNLKTIIFYHLFLKMQEKSSNLWELTYINIPPTFREKLSLKLTQNIEKHLENQDVLFMFIL